VSVAFARNADEALRFAAELHPAAITLDVLMPHVDGWAVLSRLKSTPSLAAIPVVIISVVDELSRGLVLGANDYLLKPVSRETLLTSLDLSGVPLQRVSGLRVLLVSQDGDGLEADLLSAGCEVRRASSLVEEALVRPQPVDVAIVDSPDQNAGDPCVEVSFEGRRLSIPVLHLIDASLADLPGWRNRLVDLAREEALQPARLVRAVRQAVDRGRAAQTALAQPIATHLRVEIQRAEREHKRVALIAALLSSSPDRAGLAALRSHLRPEDFLDLLDDKVLALVAYGIGEDKVQPIQDRLGAIVNELTAVHVERSCALLYPDDGRGAEELLALASSRLALEQSLTS
jgi:CheY-like chemotaxis protein